MGPTMGPSRISLRLHGGTMKTPQGQHGPTMVASLRYHGGTKETPRINRRHYGGVVDPPLCHRGPTMN